MKKKSKGLGDSVEKFTKATGIKRLLVKKIVVVIKEKNF